MFHRTSLPLTPMALVVSLAAASLGGLKVGFDLGVLNPCMRYLADDLSLEAYQEGFVMVLLIVSASLGALCAGRLADSTGLIRAQLMTAALGGVGTALSAAAFGPAALLIMSIGRLIAGLGVHSLPSSHSLSLTAPCNALLGLPWPPNVTLSLASCGSRESCLQITATEAPFLQAAEHAQCSALAISRRCHHLSSVEPCPAQPSCQSAWAS